MVVGRAIAKAGRAERSGTRGLADRVQASETMGLVRHIRSEIAADLAPAMCRAEVIAADLAPAMCRAEVIAADLDPAATRAIGADLDRGIRASGSCTARTRSAS